MLETIRVDCGRPRLRLHYLKEIPLSVAGLFLYLYLAAAYSTVSLCCRVFSVQFSSAYRIWIREPLVSPMHVIGVMSVRACGQCKVRLVRYSAPLDLFSSCRVSRRCSKVF
jgi:hypothetical protein